MSLHASDKNPVLARSLRAILHRRRVAALMLGAPAFALAGPTGEDVIRGAADITRPDATRTNITQHTDRAVINWQTFNVDADEFVTFFQPGASSIVLNRVIGGDASHILGHIEANGQVFLLNPQGVFFTHGASLDVQGFLGTTLDMDPDAFMSGDYSLFRSSASPANAEVRNAGSITAGPGGYVMLAGDFTENTGVITANAGTVALVSGNALTLDIEGDGLVNFAVSEATLSEAAGVRNAGSLIADGGRVIMTAKVANDLVATAVNNEGLVRAHSIEERGGEIYLVGYGGDVANSGTLDADGENADGGGIGIYSDRDVTLADGGVQTAAGDANHDGGVVRVVAEGRLDYQRDNILRATGGNSGGFVEVSGHGGLNLRGIPQIGPGGRFVIDPSFLNIGNTSGSSSVTIAQVATNLAAGVDVTLVASSSINAITGSINASGGGGDLTVGIGTVSAGTGSCAGPGGALCLGGVTFNQAGNGNINLAALTINIGGNLLIDAGSNGTVTTGAVTSATGGIQIFGGTITTSALSAATGIVLGNSLDNAGQVTVNGNVNAGGDVTAWTNDISGLGIDINGNISGANVTLHATGSSGATADVNVTNGITATGNVVLFASGSMAGGDVFVGSDVVGADVNITAAGGRVEIGTGIAESSFVAGDVQATAGNVSITVPTEIGNDGVIVAGNISATGNVTLTANVGQGHIHLGDYVSGILTGANISASGDINLSAQGTNARIEAGGINGNAITLDVVASSVGGLIDVGPVSGNGSVDIGVNGAVGNGGELFLSGVTGSTVTLTAIASASVGGRIIVDGNTVATSGSVNINASNAAGAASVAFNGDVSAANAVNLSLVGAFGSDIVQLNGNATATTGNINFGSNVERVSFGAGPHVLTAGGNIILENLDLSGSSGSVDYVAGGTVRFRMQDSFNAGSINAGSIDIGITASNASASIGNMVADTAISIAADITTGGTLTLTTGTLTVTGSTGALSVDIGPFTSGSSGAVTANLALGGVTDANNALFNIDVVNGSHQLGPMSGISNQLTIDMLNAGDIDSISITGGFTYTGAGTADITGNLSVGGNLSITAGAINDLFSASGISAGGNLSLTASDGDITVFDLDAGGSISITANGNSLGGGNISIAAGQAGLGIMMSASGDSAATNAGNVTIASGLLAGGNISVTALSGGNQGANITVSGGGIKTTAGSVTLYGSANNYGGNINVVGAGTVGVVATNGISIDASANGGAPTSGMTNATIDITGQVRAGSGTVNIRAGTGAQGGNSSANIRIAGTGTSAGVISGASVIIEASAAFGSGTGTNSGQVHLGFGSPEANFTGAQVNATTGNVAVFALGGLGVFTAGGINAAGSASITADGNQGHVHLGDYVATTLTAPGNITAGASVTVDVTGFQTRIDAGAITAGNVVNLGTHTEPGGTTRIRVGSLTNTATSVAGNINVMMGSTSSGLPVTGSLEIGGVTAAHTLNINMSQGAGTFTLDNLAGINDNLQISTTIGGNIGTASFSGGFIYMGANTNIDFGGNFNAGGNVFVDAATISALSGVTIGAASLAFNNAVTSMSGAAINASGIVDIRTSGSAAAVVIGDIAGTDIHVEASGTAAGFGNVTLGNVTGTGLVNIDANGGGSNGGGVLTAGNVTGGSVLLNAYANAGTGGSITVSGDVISTTGSVDVYASNFSNSGSIKLLGNVDAAGSFFGRAFGAGAGNLIEIHGDVLAGGNLEFGSGNALFFGTGSHTISAGGDVMISGANGMTNGGSVTYNAGNNVMINAVEVHTGALNAVNQVQVQGNGGASHTIGNVTAQHVDMHFNPLSGGTVNVTIGDVAVNGTTSFNRDTVIEIHGGSMGTTANLAIGNITTLNGEIVLGVFGGVSGSGLGNITVGALSAERFVHMVARGDVTTGAVTINNAADGAALHIQSHTGSSASASIGGDITVNGAISVTGHAGATNPHAASVLLETANAGAHAITVNGTVTVTGIAGTFSYSSSGNGSAGTAGIANFTARAQGGSVALGDLGVNGVGQGWVEVQAADFSVGNLSLNVADGALTRSFTLDSTFCSTTCNITGTETVNGGEARININNTASPVGASATFTGITVNAADVNAAITGFGNISGGAITLAAAGGDRSRASIGTFETAAYNFSESGAGGGAELFMVTSSAGTLNLTGALNVSAQGRAQVFIGGATVSVQDVDVSALGGTFTRTGQPAPVFQDDGPFSGNSDGGNGPEIDEGTITGGLAGVQISGVPSSSSSFSSGGGVNANSVTVTGSVTVSAPGRAEVQVRGDSIAISGTVTASADAATRNGTRNDTYTNSSAETINDVSTVTSSYGEANVELYGDSLGTVTAGGIVISGPVADGQVEGGNVTLGNVSMTATGGNVNVVETSTNLTTGVVSAFEFHGPALLSGMGLMASGTLNVGDVNVTAVGAGGTILAGAAINTGNITIAVTDANYTVVAPEFFGAGTTSFTAGNAILGFDGATANVTGSVTVTAGQQAHVAGAMAATGDVTINAGTGVTRVVAETAEFLNAIGDDSGGTIPMPAGFGVTATNINIAATTGDVDLTAATLDATTALTLSAAGGNLIVDSAALDGGAVTLGASGNLSAASLVVNTTGALSATAGAGFAALGMDATANSISLGATGTMVLDNALLTATGGIAATGSALSASAADMSGTGISLITATGGIAVDGAVLNASGLLQLDAAGNVALDDATLGGALLLLTADGSIANAGTTGSITADGAAISAGGSVNLANMTLTVGAGAAPGVSEDISLLADLAADGLAPTSATPNLHIAAGSVTLGDLVFNGDHLVVKADTLVFAGTVATSQADTLVQLAPLDATASISLVQSGSGTGTVNYSNTAHLAHFQGDTIALGTSGHSGPITIGEDGATIDIGASNLFVVTTAPVTGLDLVLSTGIVKDTNAVVVISDDFETPQSEEIDVNQDSVQTLNDEYALDESGGSDEEEEGDEEGEDTDTDADAEAEDDSLIRQDTVDEEMMCS